MKGVKREGEGIKRKRERETERARERARESERVMVENAKYSNSLEIPIFENMKKECDFQSREERE